MCGVSFPPSFHYPYCQTDRPLPPSTLNPQQKRQLVAARPQKCMYCNECMVVARAVKTHPDDDHVVIVRPNEERFIFSVEVRTAGLFYASPPGFFCVWGGTLSVCGFQFPFLCLSCLTIHPFIHPSIHERTTNAHGTWHRRRAR